MECCKLDQQYNEWKASSLIKGKREKLMNAAEMKVTKVLKS
jgi:hypothetical protein